MLSVPTKIIDYKSESGISSDIVLTENQLKILKEKFLKDESSVANWLQKIANNIALAELIYHPRSYRWGLFDGVHVSPKELLIEGRSSIAMLFHHNLYSSDEREANFRRFILNCQKIITLDPEARDYVQQWSERFYSLMSSWRFLPSTPTLMNAGRELQQLSACYVLPVQDSIEGITGSLKAQALIHKSGGGTGFSFDQLRPAGDPVKSTSGVASGAVSFIRVFDRMTDVVKQGGSRRGANMGVLNYHHPEIKDFIRSKRRVGALENFNISVALDEDFFSALSNDVSVALINPRTKLVVGHVRASELFDDICESAWISGDPGILFIDKINNSLSNPTPELGAISATNPCGEQPLYSNEPCNLGSLNLSAFIDASSNVNWAALKEAVHVAIRFLDNVIDMNNYPLPEIEALAKTNRRIGLGVMGWAEMLVQLGLAYDSPEAVEKAEEVMSFISKEATNASCELAQIRGVFPNWPNSIFNSSSVNFKGVEVRPRHCARTTIAPTGTISLIAGLQGAGIEPFYAIAYTRYTSRALDSIKRGEVPLGSDVLCEVNPLFLECAKKANYFGLDEKILWEKIEANNRSIRGIPEIPESIQRLFATSYDVDVEWHIRMQAAFQKYTDNAVSKTVNLKRSATIDDVRRAFLLAKTLGCKGVTVYRDGSKQQQVLSLTTDDHRVQRAREMMVGVSSESHDVQTIYGMAHIHIDYDENGPFRLLINVDNSETIVAEMGSAVSMLITKYLEQHGNPVKLVTHLIPHRHPDGIGIPHAAGLALREHLSRHGHFNEDTTETDILELWRLGTKKGEFCAQCGSTHIEANAGCRGMLCLDCGASVCL